MMNDNGGRNETNYSTNFGTNYGPPLGFEGATATAATTHRPPSFNAPPTNNAPPPYPGPPSHNDPTPSGAAYTNNNYNADVEAGREKEYGLHGLGLGGLDDRNIRRVFIRKVFMIVGVQLVLVTGLMALFVFQENVKQFVQANTYLYWISYAFFIGSYLAVSCCKSVRRSFPGNYICLLILTLSLGYMTAMISSMYDTKIVLMSAGICAGCCLGVIIFSMQTKWDFTKCIGVLCTLGWCLFFFGIFAVIFGVFFKVKIVYLVYSGLGALLFMAFLAVDVQLVMGNKAHALDEEDYVYAATQIFVDVVMIFLYIITIVGGSSSSS